jgi:hypothetical protein
MNLKLKALVYMVGIIGGGVSGICLIRAIALYLGPEATLNVFVGGVLIFLLYQVYGLILAKLEMDVRLEELSKK